MNRLDPGSATGGSERFAVLDILRACACVGVLLFHYVWRGPQTGWMGGVDMPLLAPIAHYGYLGVHLFFMISGFVILMTAQHATPLRFVASRVARLYPAFWAAASLTALTVWLVHDERLMVSPTDFLVNLSMLAHLFNVPYVDGAYWSLAVELHFYVMVWLVLRLGLLRHLDALLGMWLLVSAVNYLRPMYPLELFLNAKWAPLFAGGCLFLRLRLTGLSTARFSLLAAACLLAVSYAVREAGQDATQAVVAGVVIFLMFVLFALVVAGKWRCNSSGITMWAGALTYPVYLIHQHFGFALHGLLTRRGLDAIAALLLVVAVVLALAWLIHRHIEMRMAPRLKALVLRENSK